MLFRVSKNKNKLLVNRFFSFVISLFDERRLSRTVTLVVFSIVKNGTLKSLCLFYYESITMIITYCILRFKITVFEANNVCDFLKLVF